MKAILKVMENRKEAYFEIVMKSHNLGVSLNVQTMLLLF